MDEKQAARFVNVMYSWFKMFENIYLHSRDGSVAPEVWDHNKNIFASLLHTPGAQQYLSHRRGIFDPAFVQMMDSLKVPDSVIPSDNLAVALRTGTKGPALSEGLAEG